MAYENDLFYVSGKDDPYTTINFVDGKAKFNGKSHNGWL